MMKGSIDLLKGPLNRIGLVPLSDQDTVDIASAIFGDPDIGWRYGMVAEAGTPDAALRSAEAWIRDSEACWARAGWGAWSIRSNDEDLAPSGSFLGFCGFFSADDPVPDHELSYGVAKSYWRRGIATEAACAVVDWMFDIHAPECLETVAHPTANVGSRQVLEAAGFGFIGQIDYCGSVAAGHGLFDHFRMQRPTG